MMWHQSALESLAHVVKEVPSIGHLYGLRRGFRRRFGVQTGSVPADDFGARMSPQPLRGAFRAAVRQQIDDLAELQVTENRAVTTPFAPRPVVDAQHPRRLSRRHHHLTTQLSQQRRTAGQDAQLYGQTATRGSAQRQCDLLQ